MTDRNEETSRANALTEVLCGELFSALGFSNNGMIARLFSPLVRKPIHHFSGISVGFDRRVNKIGFQGASKWFLPNFIKDMTVIGSETIPPDGPLIIAANHPGAYDALVVTANVPRDDVKIIVNCNSIDLTKQTPSDQAR
jgi:hypothetical protein